MQEPTKHIRTVVQTGFRALLIVAIVGIGVFFISWIKNNYDRALENEVVENPVKVEGGLDRTYTVRKQGNRTDYTAKYYFIVDGQSYEGTAFFDEPPTKREIEVLYNPADPRKNRIAGVVTKDHSWEDTSTIATRALMLGMISGLLSLARDYFKK